MLLHPPQVRYEEISVSVLYNPLFFTFVGAVNNAVKVWSAATGELQNHFVAVCDSDITAMAFDGRLRKVIVGNSDGEVIVLNIITGEKIKSFRRHASSVASINYIGPDVQVRLRQRATKTEGVIFVITSLWYGGIVGVYIRRRSTIYFSCTVVSSRYS